MVVAEGVVKRGHGDGVEGDNCLAHATVGVEHGDDELESGGGLESHELAFKFLGLNRLDVEHVLHEAQEQVQLRYDQFERPHSLWLFRTF